MSCTNWSIKDQSLITHLQIILLSSNSISLAASTLKEMAVKAFLVIAALITGAAAYPYDSLARTAQEQLVCYEDTLITIIFDMVHHDFILCQSICKCHSTVVYTDLYDCLIQQTTVIMCVLMGYQ